MSYIVAVFTDKNKAEASYSALLQDRFSSEQVALIGEGHKSAETLGAITPNQQRGQQALRLLAWLAGIGFLTGYGFAFLMRSEFFSELNSLSNYAIGGLVGAAIGALISLLIGSRLGAVIGSRLDVLKYRDRLQAGHYLVLVNTSESFKDQAKRILSLFNPEEMQDYNSPEQSMKAIG